MILTTVMEEMATFVNSGPCYRDCWHTELLGQIVFAWPRSRDQLCTFITIMMFYLQALRKRDVFRPIDCFGMSLIPSVIPAVSAYRITVSAVSLIPATSAHRRTVSAVNIASTRN